MSSAQPPRPTPPLIGYALLLGGATAALWLAAAVVVPSAFHALQPFGEKLPAFFDAAFHISSACYHSVVPIAVAGGAFFFVGLIGRGPARLVTACRTALAILSGLVACLSLYLLSSGGVGYKIASGYQLIETQFYKRTLDEFAILETAEGRFKNALDTVQGTRGMTFKARNASEFNDIEARERVSSLIRLLPKATDATTKRRILATLCLFRERIRTDSYEARDVARHATEAGAPETKSQTEALQWIAENLNQDGWEPLPLFKLSR